MDVGDIPYAPMCAAADAGPPVAPSGPKEEFVGKRVKFVIENNIAKTPEEKMVRRAWLPRFLENSGM